MLTPEQVREIRQHSLGTLKARLVRDLFHLLADRAEIADRLQEVRMLIPNEGGGVAGRTLAALIERIRG